MGYLIAQELGKSVDDLLDGECAMLLHIASNKVVGCAIYESLLGYWPLKEICHKNEAIELSRSSGFPAMKPVGNAGKNCSNMNCCIHTQASPLLTL